MFKNITGIQESSVFATLHMELAIMRCIESDNEINIHNNNLKNL
jgi:hypothetical protein